MVRGVKKKNQTRQVEKRAIRKRRNGKEGKRKRKRALGIHPEAQEYLALN